MSGSKVLAGIGGLAALLVTAGVSEAATDACSLGSKYPVTSVSPYKRPAETGGYGGTTARELRGAEIRVMAQPGLTAEWLERRIAAQIAAGECQLGDPNASVDVVSEGDTFVVRVTSGDETGAVNRPNAGDQRAAARILDAANALPAR